MNMKLFVALISAVVFVLPVSFGLTRFAYQSGATLTSEAASTIVVPEVQVTTEGILTVTTVEIF